MVEEYSTIDKQMESVRKKNKIIDHNLSTYIKKLHQNYAERKGRVDHLIKETQSVLEAIQSDQKKFCTKPYKINKKRTDHDNFKENSEDGESQTGIHWDDEYEDDVLLQLEETKSVSVSQLSFSSLKLNLYPGYEKRQDIVTNHAYTSLGCINGHRNLNRHNFQRTSGLYNGNGNENIHFKQQEQILPVPKRIQHQKVHLNSHLHGNLPQLNVNDIHTHNATPGNRSQSRESIQWSSCMSRGHEPKRLILVTPKFNGKLSCGSIDSASTCEDNVITNEGGTSKKKKKNPRLRLPPVVPSITHRLREMDKQRAFINTLKILD